MEDAPDRLEAGPAPGWVQALHTIADPAWIRLDADELLAEASAKSGLSDFGDADFLEPYRIFVRALDAEAQLHALGRLIARSDVVNWLENRLQLADWRKRGPRSRTRPSERPSSSPACRAPAPRSCTSCWRRTRRTACRCTGRCAIPARRPRPATTRATRASSAPSARCSSGTRSCPSTGRCTSSARAAGRVHPAHRAFVRSEELLGRYQVPSYAAWYAGCDLAPAYRFHRAMLQHLQSRYRRERWVLKAPSHLPALATLFAVYPDARVVLTHRDPLKILPSVASILYSTM